MQTLLDMIANKIDPIVEQWGLSDREAQIVELFLKDITSTKDISKELGISPITVRNHLEKIYKKSGCKNKSTLIVYILQKYMEDNSNLSLFYRSPRVLVVDDEDHICEALELSLDDKGIKVHTTTNPLEVESLIKMHQFDFIICDIKMPGLNGHDLVKKLKETHYYWPRIIMITGYSEYSPEELYDQGAISYLKKPFDPDDIFKIILENYSDEENLIEKLARKPDDEENIYTLDEIKLLDKSTLGIGGAFLKLDQKILKKKELEEGSIIKFSFKVPEVEESVNNVLAQIVWKRISDGAELESGVGVKLLDNKFLTSPKYENFLMSNQIISYIPIGAS